MLHIGGSFGFFLRMLHIDKRLRGFAFKFEIVLESADNSVRKDKGRYFYSKVAYCMFFSSQLNRRSYQMLALSRIKVCLNL